MTALVVTCCEQKSEDERAAMKLELMQYAENVTKFAGKGVYLVGLPVMNDVPVPLKEHYEQLRRLDEIKLQKLVSDSKLEIPIEPAEEIKRQWRKGGSIFW